MIIIFNLIARCRRWFNNSKKLWVVFKTNRQGGLARANNVELGRSMVEMLGVLAIVGVLSVGAIAGYSKAMMKYKLNKQAQQLSLLFNLMTTYKSQWRFTSGTSLVPYYVKLKEIPDDMIRTDQPNRLYDVFKNIINMSNNNGPVFDEILLSINFAPVAGDRFAVCQNIMQVTKAFSSELLYYTVSYQAENNPSSSSSGYIYGDKYCHYPNCIKDLSLKTIEEKCRLCDNTRFCSFIFTWSLKP